MNAPAPPPGLETLTWDLARWIAAAVPDVACQVVSAGLLEAGEGVALRLFAAEPLPAFHVAPVAPHVLAVRYLLTVSLKDVNEAHRVYGELLFAALDNPALSIAPATEAQAANNSAGIPDALALLVETRLTRARDKSAAPPVLHPLVVRASDLNEK